MFLAELALLNDMVDYVSGSDSRNYAAGTSNRKITEARTPILHSDP